MKGSLYANEKQSFRFVYAQKCSLLLIRLCAYLYLFMQKNVLLLLICLCAYLLFVYANVKICLDLFMLNMINFCKLTPLRNFLNFHKQYDHLKY